MVHKVSLEIKNDILTIETGKLAKQANSSILISFGGTSVLVPVVMSKESDLNLDFFPLQVQYSEKYYAVGKIPGGFIKREGRPKDKEVLVSRLIDRPLRPLFPEGFRNEIQILPTTLSADQVNPPDILSIIGASAALTISDIPFNGPLGAVRIGLIDNNFIINPTFKEIENSKIDLVVAGTKNAIMMIEGSCNEASEETVIEAINIAYENIQNIIFIQEKLRHNCGKEKATIKLFEVNSEIHSIMNQFKSKVAESFNIKSKSESNEARKLIYKEAEEKIIENKNEEIVKLIENKTIELHIKSSFKEIEYEVVREMINNHNKRVDERKMDEIRPIDCEIDLLARTHGSSLFTRGETQSLSVVTLGTTTDMQRFDDIEGEGTKNFLLHYNFPPFSVGETGRTGSPGRREIGHGALAEKAIIPVLPNLKDFPYTIRIVSEILESNGSSSMATVCASSLALQTAGVPISKSVSGIAMGLITLGDKFKILTDIQGIEDSLGDMDFKMAGTTEGITALQLDTKIEGITLDIIKETCHQAKKARLEIINTMNKTIKKPKEVLSKYAPKIITFNVNADKIKDIIGAGGKIIRKIISDTNANIDIDNNGKILISSKDEQATQMAYEKIKILIANPEVGKVYNGTVKKITEFGAFIEILPGKEGLCHISCLSKKRVNKVEDVLKENEKVTVKCIDIDDIGRIRLSIKDL